MLFIESNFKAKSNTLFLELLDRIDAKIYEIAKVQLNNVRFAFSNKVNYDTFEDLVVYRDILEGIIYCSTCLCDINTDSVHQRINKLLNTNC